MHLWVCPGFKVSDRVSSPVFTNNSYVTLLCVVFVKPPSSILSIRSFFENKHDVRPGPLDTTAVWIWELSGLARASNHKLASFKQNGTKTLQLGRYTASTDRC